MTFLEWQYLIWSAKVLVKIFLNVLFLKSTSPLFSPKPLECKMIININNIIVLINVTFLMKKIQDSSINSKKFGFLYYQKFMPSYRHTLFYFWLKYESLWTNIVIIVDSFSIKLRSGTMFLKRVPRHLKTCLNHKQSQQFQSQRMWISNGKKNRQNKWIGKYSGHSK
jgi:hypothetical protein